MDPHWARFVELARPHDGVVTWREAMAIDVPSHRLHAWQRAGRIARPVPQVDVVAGAPVSWRQRVRIATGSGAAWASTARPRRSPAWRASSGGRSRS